MSKRQLAVVLKGYPRLSETFIAQELLNLERSGITLTLYSLRHPTDKKTHPVNDEIQAMVVYLPEYLYQESVRVFRSWIKARKYSGFPAAWRAFRKDLARDRTANRIRRFGQAMVMAAELPDNVPALYAHFLHTPASVTRYTAMIRGLPWSCSAHAKDIYTSPDWEIAEKLDHLQWLTTCTKNNVRHLQALTPSPLKVSLNYHGLDLQRFENEKPVYQSRDGSEQQDPVQLLSVGRAVEKKGYADLLNALARLPVSLHWQLHHIGGGPLRDELQHQAERQNIADRIHWHGAQSQQFVLEHYRSADIFVLNSCIDRHGDRDGLPNVMVEAQSQGLPVIGTTISGIPELVTDQTNGLLIESGDVVALEQAVGQLISNPSLREQLGQTGREIVHAQFEMKSSFIDLQKKIQSLIE